jgi:hypothetical protein
MCIAASFTASSDLRPRSRALRGNPVVNLQVNQSSGQKLFAAPASTVPAITIGSDFDGAAATIVTIPVGPLMPSSEFQI